MEIWLGVGDHEVQMDLRGPGLSITLPQSSLVKFKDKRLEPISSDESTSEYDLCPVDRGECQGDDEGDTCRSWDYQITYILEDETNSYSIDYIVNVCRQEDGTWGLCLYPETSSGSMLVFPDYVSESLESIFEELPPEGWSFTPHVIVGGLKEGAG